MGKPISGTLAAYLETRVNKTITLPDAIKATGLEPKQIQQWFWRAVKQGTFPGLKTINQGQVWRYVPPKDAPEDPHAEQPPGMHEALAARPVEQPEPKKAKQANGFGDFHQVGWSRQSDGRLLPLVNDQDGITYRCLPV